MPNPPANIITQWHLQEGGSQFLLACPTCANWLTAPVASAGTESTCPYCSTRSTLPSPRAVEEAWRRAAVVSPAQPNVQVAVAKAWKVDESLFGRFSIAVRCPYCNCKVTVSVDASGTVGTCPECTAPFMIPAEAGERVRSLQEKRQKDNEGFRQRQQEACDRRKAESEAQQLRLAAEKAAKEVERRVALEKAAQAARERCEAAESANRQVVPGRPRQDNRGIWVVAALIAIGIGLFVYYKNEESQRRWRKEFQEEQVRELHYKLERALRDD